MPLDKLRGPDVRTFRTPEMKAARQQLDVRHNSPSNIAQESAAEKLTRASEGKWHGTLGGCERPVCTTPRTLVVEDGDRKPIWRCLHGCDRRAISSIFRRRGLYNAGRP